MFTMNFFDALAGTKPAQLHSHEVQTNFPKRSKKTKFLRFFSR